MTTGKKTTKKVRTRKKNSSTLKKAGEGAKAATVNRAGARRKAGAPAKRGAKKPAASSKAEETISRLQPPSQDDIARLAYRLWEERGRPFDSPDRDWFEAESALTTTV